ncbi:MCE family protein [Gordonia sp. CPCC 205515]|uniref:MCE family protein n=1 Tax=Gordonia sp. CPCC 205515 TaxID=3140791 RepID=UPI003AF335BF
MSRKQERSRAVRRTAAVVMVGSLVVIIAAAAGQFLGWFADTEPVTLEAPRAGLVMNPDAKVKLRGVEVGRVESITETDSKAVLKLNINADQMSQIPGNVGADIKSNTVFGAKAVDLVVPASGASGTLQSGQTISGDQVVVELNTVYQQLVSVLAQMQPDKLNATLGAIDTALSGRGEQTGVALEQLSDLLGKTNPHLPELNRLLAETATATNVYADAMPSLMRDIDNFTVIGNTLVDNSANLDALLINATGMANTIDGVISPSKARLMATLSNFSPVASMLGYQAPGLACFITASAIGTKKAAPIFGGEYGLTLFAGLLPGSEPYRYPENLPRNNVDGPPTCEGGLGDPDSAEHVDFYVGDNAEQPYAPRTKPKADRTKLFQLLFGAPPRG